MNKIVFACLLALTACTSVEEPETLDVASQEVDSVLCPETCLDSNWKPGVAICHYPSGSDEPQSRCIHNYPATSHLKNHQRDYCGACDPFCGDNTCNGTEDCSTCAADCGECPVCE